MPVMPPSGGVALRQHVGEDRRAVVEQSAAAAGRVAAEYDVV